MYLFSILTIADSYNDKNLSLKSVISFATLSNVKIFAGIGEQCFM